MPGLTPPSCFQARPSSFPACRSKASWSSVLLLEEEEEACFIMSRRVEGGVGVAGWEGVEGSSLVRVLLLLLLEAVASSDETLPVATEDRGLYWCVGVVVRGEWNM